MQRLSNLKKTFSIRDLMLLIGVALGLIAMMSGLLLFAFPDFHDYGTLLMAGGQTLAEWSGMILLLLNGTLMKTKYWKFITAAVCVLIMSSLFAILHLAGADELRMLGVIAVLIIYTIRNILRKQATVFDWVKYAWIASWLLTTVLILFLKWSQIWSWIPALLFWITLVMFLNIRSRQITPGATEVVS